MTTDGSPLVMSHAWVVCVRYQPHAPPATANGCGNDGSFGSDSWGASTESGSAWTTAALRLRASSAVLLRSDATDTTWTFSPAIVRSSRPLAWARACRPDRL